MRITRRGVQLVLGVIWILDGALQLQPVMFTKQFATGIIAPAGAGQPAPVHWLVATSATLFGHAPIPFGVVFAAVQLALGFGLLWQRTAKVALGASIAWAIGVWIFGEGFGGVFGSGASALLGAPGGAILYALLGAASWPTHKGEPVADRAPARWLPLTWALLWASFAVFELLPGQFSGSAVASDLRPNFSALPEPLAHAGRSIASTFAGTGIVVPLVLAVAFVLIAAAALRPGTVRLLGAVGGGVLALAIWIFAESFGAISTGMATDPNTGPLLVLFALAMWAAVPLEHRGTARSGATLEASSGGLRAVTRAA